VVESVYSTVRTASLYKADYVSSLQPLIWLETDTVNALMNLQIT